MGSFSPKPEFPPLLNEPDIIEEIAANELRFGWFFRLDELLWNDSWDDWLVINGVFDKFELLSPKPNELPLWVITFLPIEPTELVLRLSIFSDVCWLWSIPSSLSNFGWVLFGESKEDNELSWDNIVSDLFIPPLANETLDCWVVIFREFFRGDTDDALAFAAVGTGDNGSFGWVCR